MNVQVAVHFTAMAHSTRRTTLAITSQLLTVPQTAQMLNLSKAKVYGLIQAGRLSVIKIDRSTRITQRAIDDFLRHAEEQTAVQRQSP